MASLREMEILIGYEFRDGETVMTLEHADLFARVRDSGFLISGCRAFVRGHEIRSVPFIEAAFITVADRQLDGLDRDQVLLLSAQFLGDLRRRNDGTGRAVADTATVKKPQRPGDDRGRQDLIDRHRFPQVSLGIQGAVGVAFYRNTGDGLFDVVIFDLELGDVGGSELGKKPRSGCIGEELPHEGSRRRTPGRQSSVPRILQLLNAKGQTNIISARRDAVNRAAKCFRTRSTIVFHPGNGNVGQTKSQAHRRSPLPHIDLIHTDAVPGRLNIFLFNACIGDRFLKGLNHQPLGSHIPSLTEPAAPHTNDRDFISNS